MMYYDFHGLRLSRLGFGAMRLPLASAEPGTPIDEAQVQAMVDTAIAHGVNYFDTAYPYHSGESERVLGRALRRHPRDKWYLATKFPGHQVSERYDPAAVFEEQLRKCGVDSFDFYLLHNVYENSLQTYEDPRWGIIDYFVEQRRKGRIGHLGFSTHGREKLLRTFLDRYGAEMEFCQIQLNYLDWTLQDAKATCALLAERGLPVWVMEPVRGGRLAKLSEAEEAVLHALRPDESPAAWAFRWLQGLPNIGVVLSGMSSLAQMEENVRTFDAPRPLDAREEAALLSLAEGMKNSVPCTACRYCCAGCPQGLEIPALLGAWNELRFAPSFNVGMRLDALPPEKRPEACVSCGQCVKVCPQGIDIPAELRAMAETLRGMPTWAELCRQREAAQKR